MEEQPVCIQNESACLAEAHDSSRVLDQETGVSEVSEYCKDLLMRGQEEMNFEELRAERYFELKKKKMQEKLQRLKEEEEQLRQELEKKRQQRLSVSQARNSCKPAASFHVYESAEENPSGKSEAASSHRPNDLIVKSDEKGLCLKVLFPGLPEGVVSSRGSQNSEPEQYGLQKLDLGKVGAKQMYRGDSKRSGPLTISKPQENLSPIEEISVESASLPSPEGCSPIERDHSTQPAAVNPCDADVRRRLLENSDIFSSPNLHSQSGSLPAVTEHSCLHRPVFVCPLQVDSCSTPWDFYQFGRLRSSSAGAGLPLISCFLFDDGCITVYTPPQDHTFTELMESVQDSSELVGCKAVGLLQLLLQLHSCRLLQAALRPNVLTCCHIGCQEPACIFPIDWSTSVDLDLQQNITSVQHLPSAQPYIHLGLLEPNDPPHLVDLVGVAETVHLLLTNSAMVLVKDASGWQVEQFSGDGPCDIDTTMWRRFFRSLLNAGRRSPTSILTELKEQLVSLYL